MNLLSVLLLREKLLIYGFIKMKDSFILIFLEGNKIKGINPETATVLYRKHYFRAK